MSEALLFSALTKSMKLKIPPTHAISPLAFAFAFIGTPLALQARQTVRAINRVEEV